MNSKAIKRQLLAAIAMVLVAAIALGSSTYAWFVGNNTVTAQGMKVQAQAESGILIKSVENASDKFSTVANANMGSAQKLYPVSTIDLSNWYHAVSDTYADAKAQQTTTGAYELKESGLESYFVKKTFIIRSADAANPVNNVDLAVTTVSVSNDQDQNTTENLDKAIRIGVKVTGESDFYIYAPRYTLQSGETAFTLHAVYAKKDTETAVPTLDEKLAPDSTNGDRIKLTNKNHQIPNNDQGIVAEVYIWYEGEDPECKSSNLPLDSTTQIDKLSVSVSFKTVEKTKTT